MSRSEAAMERSLPEAFLRDLHEVMPTFCRHHKLEFPGAFNTTPKLFNALKGTLNIFKYLVTNLGYKNLVYVLNQVLHLKSQE